MNWIHFQKTRVHAAVRICLDYIFVLDMEIYIDILYEKLAGMPASSPLPGFVIVSFFDAHCKTLSLPSEGNVEHIVQISVETFL